MTELARFLKYKIVNDRWIYSGPILLAFIVFFGVQNREEELAYSDENQVRYTIAKIRDFDRSRGAKWFNCYYSDGNAYRVAILHLSGFTNQNEYLNKFVWVKYSLKDLSFSDVMDIDVYRAIEDSIPVPLTGKRKNEFDSLMKSIY